MINYYSSNYIQTKSPYNQINIEKINKQINLNKQRASSINIDKIKTKIIPQNDSLNKKSTTLKTISVNKQIQYKKKTPIKNKSQLNPDPNYYFSAYNGVSYGKDASYNSSNIITKNPNISSMNKNMKIYKGKNGANNYSNNKLRRKMIL